MAKKKRKSSGKQRKSGRISSRAPELDALPELPDWRALEGMLHQLLPGLAHEGGNTALERAQDLIYEAMEATGAKQSRLAREALAISPDCADAYVVLAENAATADEAIDLYEKGVAAGQRAIGRKRFEEYAGHFWGFLETRPYMRARHGLARTLWEVGRRDEAISHLDEMLRLNPNDNQGLRYVLLAWLVELERDQESAALMAQYDEKSTEWAYASALLAFRREGDSAAARKLLARAKKANKHVPAYLLGDKEMPAALPPYVSPGREDEAIAFAAGYRPGWSNTPGAVTWLRQTLQIALPEAKTPKPRWTQQKQSLLRLPQAEGEVWQVGVRRLSDQREDVPADVDLWMLLVADPAEGVVNFDVVDEAPKPADAWDFLTYTMTKPKTGDPRRPEAIEVGEEALFKAWGKKLAQIGIACSLAEELETLTLAFEQLDHVAAHRHAASEPLSDLETDPAALLELPQREDDLWQADVRPLPTWITGEGAPQRPWGALAVSVTSDLVLAHQVQMEPPDAAWLWECLVRAMRRPAMGDPHRPGVVQVGTLQLREGVEPLLRRAGIDCVVSERLETIDQMLDDMARHLGATDQLCPLVQVPGVAVEQLGSFFEAAAEFYRRKPWRLVPGDTPIRVSCTKFQSGPWYAVVMGQSGMTLGLALYDDYRALKAILEGDASDEVNARRTSSLSLLYSEAFEIPVQDLDAVERYGWPVAGPEAYPMVLRVNPGQAVRAPLAWELDLLEGCIRLMPGFLKEKPPRKTATVPIGTGDLTLELSWVE